MAAADTPIYAPNPLYQDATANPQALGRWTLNELQILARVLSGVARLQMSVLNRAPAVPRAGMVAYADGTHWNPGGGEGLYLYKSDLAWHKIV